MAITVKKTDRTVSHHEQGESISFHRPDGWVSIMDSDDNEIAIVPQELIRSITFERSGEEPV